MNAYYETKYLYVSCSIGDKFRKMLNYAAYARWEILYQLKEPHVGNKIDFFSWLQRFLVQATYWHDPLKEEIYRKSSTFLADINNELTINATYVENLKKLNKWVHSSVRNVKFNQTEQPNIMHLTDLFWWNFPMIQLFNLLTRNGSSFIRPIRTS